MYLYITSIHAYIKCIYTLKTWETNTEYIAGFHCFIIHTFQNRLTTAMISSIASLYISSILKLINCDTCWSPIFHMYDCFIVQTNASFGQGDALYNFLLKHLPQLQILFGNCQVQATRSACEKFKLTTLLSRRVFPDCLPSFGKKQSPMEHRMCVCVCVWVSPRSLVAAQWLESLIFPTYLTGDFTCTWDKRTVC